MIGLKHFLFFRKSKPGQKLSEIAVRDIHITQPEGNNTYVFSEGNKASWYRTLDNGERILIAKDAEVRFGSKKS